MKALVIGGTRFVGLHLVNELSNRGDDVTVLNRGRTQAALPAGVKHIVCDRKDPVGLKAALGSSQFDAVFDIIAMVPDDVRPLVEILDGHVGRYVQVSTGSVYKAVDVFPWKECFEKVTDNSAGDYGYNKQLIEEILFDAYNRRRFPVAMIRPGYIYGPHNNVYRESLFFDRVVKGRPVLVPGDGHYLTQFGHVDDLARLLVLAATRPEAVGEAFNFSGEYSYLMNEYVEAIFEAAGRRTEVVHFEPEALCMPVQDVSKVFPYRWRSHTVRDTSKAQYLLGYKEQITLRQGLRQAFEWFVRDGVEKKQIDFTLEDRIIAGVCSRA